MDRQDLMVFSPAWFEYHQTGLLKFANSFVGRRVLRIHGSRSDVGSNKITKIEPHSITWKIADTYSTEFRTHAKYSKRLYHAFKPLWHLFHAWDLSVANNLKPALNLGFDTLTKFPQAGNTPPIDGYVGRLISNPGESFSALNAGVGNDISTTASSNNIWYLLGSTTSNQFRGLRRGMFCFDTSSLTTGANISAATISVNPNSKSSGLGTADWEGHIVSLELDSPDGSEGDYSNFGSDSFGSIASYAAVSLGSYNDITLNALGIAHISKTGISEFGARTSWELDDTFGGTWASAAQTQVSVRNADFLGTFADPKLVVIYTTGEASISGTLLLSGTATAEWHADNSISGTLLLSGEVTGYIATDTSVIEKKTFLHKVYDENGNFVSVWDDVISEPDWSGELNTVGSSVSVLLARNSDTQTVAIEALQDNTGASVLDNNSFEILTSTQSRNKVGPGSDVNHNYRVDIYVYYGETVTIDDSMGIPIQDSEGNNILGTIGAPNGIRRFSGFISEININYGDSENTQVELMSFGYDLDQYPVVNALGETTVAFNSTGPSDMVMDGLDQFVADGIGTYTNYETSTIEVTGTTPSYTFRAQTYKELLEVAVKLAPAGWSYWVGLGDNLVRFQAKPSVATHTFFLGKHIKNLNLRSYIGSAVNDLLFIGGGDPALYKRYTVTPVAGTRRGLSRISDNRVELETSADILADGEIDEKKNIQYRSTVEILDKVYDIESIELGQLIAFRNFDNNVDLITMQVVGYHYTPDSITLALDTLPPTVPKRLEELRKALDAQETETVPIEPDV